MLSCKRLVYIKMKGVGKKIVKGKKKYLENALLVD